MNPDYEQLLEASEVSPFGHNAKTVIDPTVRKASHIPADRITAIEGLDLDPIVESVRLKLFPQETKIQAKVRDYPNFNHCLTFVTSAIKAKHLSRGRLLCPS